MFYVYGELADFIEEIDSKNSKRLVELAYEIQNHNFDVYYYATVELVDTLKAGNVIAYGEYKRGHMNLKEVTEIIVERLA